MNEAAFFRHHCRNSLQSFAIAAALASLFGGLAWLLGGVPLLVIALGMVVALYLLNPLVAPPLVLGLYGAIPLDAERAPQLLILVQMLARNAGLPRTPRLYAMPGRGMNAFALGGRDQSIIVLSIPLLQRLNWRELAGVLAHEIGHICNDDLQALGFADLLTRVTRSLSLLGQILLALNLPLLLITGQALAWWPILILVFAPFLSALLQLALSRTREYDADLAAARLLGDPGPLIAALRVTHPEPNPSLGQLFWPIRRHEEPSLLRTHPAAKERIRRLRQLKPTAVTQLPRTASGPLLGQLGIRRIGERLQGRYWL